MKKHLQIGNWSHFSGEARQPNGDPRLITTSSFRDGTKGAHIAHMILWSYDSTNKRFFRKTQNSTTPPTTGRGR